jgi:hypothetical protein
MPPSAMAMQGQMMPGTDPAFWHGHEFPSEPLSPLSPPLSIHLSPSTSATSQSFNGSTPPRQTPSGEVKKTAQELVRISQSQKEASAAQARASVAVACVPCRSRHLKCDGGVRCSRCRTDNVECTYIKSRRGWKGKRKNREDNGGPVTVNGALYHNPPVQV